MKRLSRILHYLADYKSKIALYFLTNILQILFSVASLAMPAPVLQVLFSDAAPAQQRGGSGLVQQLSGWVSHLLLRYDKPRALATIIVIVVSFSILKNVFLYLSLSIINPLRNDIVRRLRDDLFKKTITLPIGFFTEERKGDLLSRMTNDINEVQLSIMSTLESFVREPFTIIFYLVAMLIISPHMTLFLLLFLPVTGLLIGRIGKSLRRHSSVVQEQLGRMLGVMDETLAGMRAVKAFNAEKHQHLRFMELNNEDLRIRNRIAYRRELGSPLSETMGIIVVGVVLWYGGNLIFHQKTSADWLFTFIAMFSQIISPFKDLSNSFLNIQKGSAALDRIEQLLKVENTIQDPREPVSIRAFGQSVELRDVDFNYGDKKILTGINLRVDKGRTVALVGASGSGKSTLVDLIPRFHDVSAGAVLVDGTDVKAFRVSELRRLMGIVGQDPILFNDTIYNNIVLGNSSATPEQVREAARIAHAHDFITTKPEGYETVVGDRGSRLSGGERQRITIARAVLKNPPILILDEATSSLDTESERIVQDAINTLMRNRTCIVIAHRLSTVKNADLILVLDKGRIVQRGTHYTLMQEAGTYRRLVGMQQVR